jgi:hypothetical protein
MANSSLSLALAQVSNHTTVDPLPGSEQARREEGQSTYRWIELDKVLFAGHKAGETLQTT